MKNTIYIILLYIADMLVLAVLVVGAMARPEDPLKMSHRTEVDQVRRRGTTGDTSKNIASHAILQIGFKCPNRPLWPVKEKFVSKKNKFSPPQEKKNAPNSPIF